MYKALAPIWKCAGVVQSGSRISSARARYRPASATLRMPPAACRSPRSRTGLRSSWSCRPRRGWSGRVLPTRARLSLARRRSLPWRACRQKERKWQQIVESDRANLVLAPREVNRDGTARGELADSLPASAAGRARKCPAIAVRRPDRNLGDSKSSAFGLHTGSDRARFRTIAKWIGHVFDIGAQVHGTARGTDRSTDSDSRIRRMRLRAAATRGGNQRIVRSHGCIDMERVMGIEPTLAAWEAAVLPLNYTRRMPEFQAFPVTHNSPGTPVRAHGTAGGSRDTAPAPCRPAVRPAD